jgi:hypothetical protein
VPDPGSAALRPVCSRPMVESYFSENATSTPLSPANKRFK